MHDRIAAIIPTHDRRDLLLGCIEALLRQERPPDRIILVDNASTDGSMEAVRERFGADHPLIEIHRMGRNTGASGGFREATRIAVETGFEWVWYTDDDSEPRGDALGRLLDADAELRSRGNRAAGLASLKVGTDGRVQAAHNGRFTWRQIALPERNSVGIVPVDYAAFTGLLVRTEAIRNVGPPDPDYFIWGGDVEFSLRLGKAGGVFVVPASVILHKDGQNATKNRFELGGFWRYYFGIRDWVRLARKHRGRWTSVPIFLACLYLIAANWRKFERRALCSRVILRAYRHGLANNLSEPLTPDRWKEILARGTL